MEQKLNIFLQHLDSYKAGLSGKEPVELYEPENYILSLGGKRIRPLLALMGCDLFGEDPRKALDAALTVELFHNFSLIHDDILDKAPLRRGQKTVHEKWNNDIAILSGDVMLVKAFESLKNYPPDLFKPLFNVFTKTAVEVCEGQQWDMNFEKKDSVSVGAYINMITYKTAVLLGCSLQMGAIAAKAGKEDQEHLYSFGKHIGIAFQLLDDLLDAFPSNEENFGKQIGGDIISNKKTFLLLKAMELADKDLLSEIKALLSREINPDEKVKQMLGIYTKLDVASACRELANQHTNTALGHLEKIKADQHKIVELRSFAINLLNRTY